ncbi:MAG: hypothetical protein QG612_580 [Pseudomonadota bacterium]|nr:hypothetical protein [Pseudomonadota bacterium]
MSSQTSFPHSPEGWSRFLLAAAVPVLADTAEQLTELALLEERRGTVDAHMIAEAVRGDPLMTLKVLSHVGRHRTSHQITEVQTVTAAVVLMGIGPFFHAFPPAGLRVLEEDLSLDGDRRLQDVMRLLERAWLMARIVTAFELQHADPHAETMQGAAVMHNLAEVLLWCRAPGVAQQLGRDPDQERQREVLGCSLTEVQQALIQEACLPSLLGQLLPHIQDAVMASERGRQAWLLPQRRLLALSATLAMRAEGDPAEGLQLDELEELAHWLGLSTPAAERLAQQALR